MPKVTIIEKDNTTATAASTFENFTVLVPGLVDITKKAKFEKVVDENGVYKIKSLADFKDYLGYVPANLGKKFYITTEASDTKISAGDVAPIETPRVSAVVKASTVESLLNKEATASEEGYNSRDITLKLYRSENDTISPTSIVVTMPATTTTTATPAKKAKAADDSSEDGYLLCFATKNAGSTSDSEPKPGRLKTVTLQFIPIESKDDFNDKKDKGLIFTSTGSQSEDKDTTLYVIKKSEAGKDATVGIKAVDFVQYGNRMAYDLFSMGYPVLYKSLGYIDTTTTFDINSLISAAATALATMDTANNLQDEASKFTACAVDFKDELEDTTEIMQKLTTDIVDDRGMSFWAPLMDKAEYNFRYVVNGLVSNNAEANKRIITLAASSDSKESLTNTADLTSGTLASARGDAIALCDIDDSCYLGMNRKQIVEKVKAYVNNVTAGDQADKYAAFFMPTVKLNSLPSSLLINPGYSDPDNTGALMPASFYYLACAIKALNDGFPEWFAVAGFTRGVCNYSVTGISAKIGDAVINALEPRTYKDKTTDLLRAVNVIATIRSNQYLWGNRTAFALMQDTQGDLRASHFLNIRQLCTTLKKEIYTACRRFTFDPNSDVLWFNFCNAIKPTLDKMKANQGIEDYKIVRQETEQRATLKARLRIVPIEAVEDFDIEVALEDNLGETSVSVSDNM